MAKRYHIQTFGCQMNEHDSEIIAGMLENIGYERTYVKREADVAVINTCSVRENADKRFFGTLGQLKKRKEERAEFLACVCGCMAQQSRVRDEIKEKYPWVDIIFGTHNIHEFPSLIEKAEREQTKITEVLEEAGPVVEGLPCRREFRHRAYVNIMYGCDNFCSYCVVPYTRGRERSRQPEAIEEEVRALAADGAREIMLLGQNVNSYRPGDGTDFADLIRRLNDVDDISRIRFMTSHPKDFSDRLIQAFADCEKLCRNVHLPAQSGSDAVLARMNRKYTRAGYTELTEKIKAACPGITMSTDIIVGFPGETERDFEDTLDLVREVRYDSAFTFLYSARPGTPACDLPDRVPDDVAHERFDRLTAAVNAISAEKNAAYMGRTEYVLADGRSKTDPARQSGRTDGNKLVNFSGPRVTPGEIVPVRITACGTFSLEGIYEPD